MMMKWVAQQLSEDQAETESKGEFTPMMNLGADRKSVGTPSADLHLQSLHHQSVISTPILLISTRFHSFSGFQTLYFNHFQGFIIFISNQDICNIFKVSSGTHHSPYKFAVVCLLWKNLNLIPMYISPNPIKFHSFSFNFMFFTYLLPTSTSNSKLCRECTVYT